MEGIHVAKMEIEAWGHDEMCLHSYAPVMALDRGFFSILCLTATKIVHVVTNQLLQPCKAM